MIRICSACDKPYALNSTNFSPLKTGGFRRTCRACKAEADRERAAIKKAVARGEIEAPPPKPRRQTQQERTVKREEAAKRNIGHWKTPERVASIPQKPPLGRVLHPKNDAQMVQCLTQMLDARGYAMDMPLEVRGKLLARIQEGVR